MLPSSFFRASEMCSRSRTTAKPSFASAARTLAFGASAGNFGIERQFGLGDEGVEDRRFVGKGIGAERLDVESNRRAHVRERVVVRVAFTDDHAAQADGIGDVAVFVALDDALDAVH